MNKKSTANAENNTTSLNPVLYVVATPLGNRDDISLRALSVLRQVAAIACEDTRHSRPLLQHYAIEAPCFALHEHNEASAASRLIDYLTAGQAVALISDAGTPAISDPGARAVAAVRAAGFEVIPLPGASALVTAFSAAGLPPGPFWFEGFLPSKTAARRARITTLRALPAHLAFYEAPHRISDTVADLAELLEGERQLVIARELTKLFEQIVSLPLTEAPAWLAADSHRQRGEFVLMVEAPPPPTGLSAQALQTLALLQQELPLKQAVKLAASISGESRNALYEAALARQKS